MASSLSKLLAKLEQDSIADISQYKEEIDFRLMSIFHLDHYQPIPPRENPLNHLLTAFDATERVILRCFVECNFRRRFRRFYAQHRSESSVTEHLFGQLLAILPLLLTKLPLYSLETGLP
ncbi:hypothetical protein L207DRAFT_578511 [Hyaloscypha variabilis F]|uniref:Uncharacterized protein n=1 Tax=Hyaloscypha variabilis (strain UAMH 11265 / GT02V1 / F) TaxID=1149755 RepID=A0A2J6S4C0_HYAVF|nr:hypothetical protein L207DRAFT_578511 [Hyaloscypha variabilis F]